MSSISLDPCPTKRELNAADIDGDVPVESRKRGRPKKVIKGEVIRKLLDVTEQLLEEGGNANTTEKKIASRAGVSEAIIHYYFHGKDGLIAAVLDRFAAEIAARLITSLDESCAFTERPVRRIVRALIDIYYAKPELAQVMIVEMTRESVIRSSFRARYGMQGMARIEKIIHQIKGNNRCDETADAAHVALSLFAMVSAPLFLTRIAGKETIDIAKLREEPWVDFLTVMIERRLGLAKSSGE